MRRNRLHCLLLSLLLLVIVSQGVWGQTGSGVVKGTTSDTSGGVIPEAKVTLTNQDTNIVRHTQTSGNGIYYFGEIPPGSYTLVIEHPGFKMWSGKLVVQVGQTVVIDPALQVGSAKTTVEVTAAAPAISTEGMQVAGVKDAQRIHQLPLNGRSVSQLFNLTPGVEGGGAPRVNGLKVGSTEMLQDGISIVDRFGGGISRVQPGLDTVQEFRIETSGSSARYSRPATVTLVTKSGTNQLHGSIFETHRNNGAGLRARQRQDGDTPAKLIRNEFGGSAGGPVYLPGIYNGRDRTFWFFSYEGLRQREKMFQSDNVPTPAMWLGDFSQVFDNSNVQTHIYDPLTTDANGIRTQFANDRIPTDRLSGFFKVMQSVTHVPTNATNPFQGDNMETFYPQTTTANTITVKGDHRFSEKDSLSGRFTRSGRQFTQTGGRFGSPAEGLTNGFGTSRTDSRVYNISVTGTHLFSPNFLNQLLLAANRNPNGQGTLADFTNWAQKLGLPNPFGVTGWPTISSDPFGWDADNRKDQNLTAYVVEDNLTLVRGRHALAFGGRVRREYNNVRELQQAQGSHTFGSAWTSLYLPEGDRAKSNTGVDLASLALGLPTSLSNQFNRGFFYFQQSELGFYFQDSWKVTPRLTLELGLRWDKWTPYSEKYDRLVNVDVRNFANRFEVVTPGNAKMESLPGVPPSVLASWAALGLTWKTAREAGLPDRLIPGDNKDFGPRLGAAFRLTNKTVLRGGYGEYFWTMPLSQILQTSRTNPPLNLRYRNAIGTFDGTSSFAIRTVPRPDFFVGRAGVDINGVIIIPPGAQQDMPWDFTNWRDGRAQEWHFTIEHELVKNTALRLSYIGDHATHLEQRFSLNAREAEFNFQARTGQLVPKNRDLLRTNPNWGFLAGNKTGFSNTHSLQAEVERRYSSGLAFQWFYTFTRSLTTSDAGASTSGNGNINDTGGTPEVPDNIQLFGEPTLSYEQRLRLVYYNSTNVPLHRMRWNAIYDLPFGKAKRFGSGASGLLNTVIGGWQIAAIGDWRSGMWLSVNPREYLFGNPILDPDQRLILTFNGRPQRLYFRGDFDPRLASNVSQEALQALVPVERSARVMHPLGEKFDNRLPQTLANGTKVTTPIGDIVNPNSRAFILGPRAWNVDTSLRKNFTLKEAKRVQFTADFFNFFNHPNDRDPDGTTGLQDLSRQTNDPRIIQLSLRLEW